MKQIILATLAAVLVSTTSWAQALKVGDKLPKLDVTYLNEEPKIEGNPVLVEFWATWCPPCRESIPHLNKIHEKFKGDGLVIIGISDEKAGVIEAFRKKVPMNYSVAIDKGAGLAEDFGADGIPHAALVDKEGKIVWIGHPMELTERQVAKVVK